MTSLIELILRGLILANRVMDWATRNGLHEWMGKLEAIMDDLEKAQTSDEEKDVAKRLSDLIHSL